MTIGGWRYLWNCFEVDLAPALCFGPRGKSRTGWLAPDQLEQWQAKLVPGDWERWQAVASALLALREEVDK